MNAIHITGQLPPRFREGFGCLKDELKFDDLEQGFPVSFEKSDGFGLTMREDSATIRWSKTSECYRGLSLLRQHWGECHEIRQTMAFETAGIMFDVSRNAVLKPETIRFLLRKMTMLGLNLGMMYTEDTYEVEEYPYFGYLRGKYSKAQLRELDDYADALGIELVPCIQTLAHLNRALHWPAMAHMKDTEEVLLVEDEAALEFIRAMIRNATEPYRSNRIHIGMDEAHFLGLGGYLRKHGYTDPFTIMERHLKNVSAIIREMGLDAMMWSDMYFRLASPTGGYYDAPFIPEEVIAKAPADIDLVYWDYYQMDEAVYERMMSMHRQFSAKTAFACGIWTWTGPAPHPQRALDTILPGLRQAKKYGVPLTFATGWGDNGAECPMVAGLYPIVVYGEMCYNDDYDPDACAARFRAVAGAEAEPFMELTRFNQLPGINDWSLRPVNASKFLLYQDPIVPLYDDDLKGVDTQNHYAQLELDYRRYQQENPEYDLLLGFYAQLARTLKYKCAFHLRAGTCIREGNRDSAALCAALAWATGQELEKLRQLWRDVWYHYNRIYGFEILDVRIGGVAARMESAARLMEDFADGRIDTIEPLAEEPLPYTDLPGGALRGSYAWGEIVSACKADL